MIPRPSVLSWEEQQAPWQEDWQIEHDLMMSRVLVEIYSHKLLSENLLFIGGTALGKLYFNPPHRFSVDLDFVQIEKGPIKETIQYPLLHEVMDKLPVSLSKYGPSNLGYKYFFDFDVWDPAIENSRIKIEVNTREHFAIREPNFCEYAVRTEWFEGRSKIKTCDIQEMLARKLLALYDRKKGRDLFDLWYASENKNLNSKSILSCYKEYIEKVREGGYITRAQYEENLSQKLNDPSFTEDVRPLLREGVEYNSESAAEKIHKKYLRLLSGDPYRGEDNFFN